MIFSVGGKSWRFGGLKIKSIDSLQFPFVSGVKLGGNRTVQIEILAQQSTHTTIAKLYFIVLKIYENVIYLQDIY